MCGISGEISFNGTPDQLSVEKMGNAISHRGPDGVWIHNEENLSVAFNWLAITDRKSTPPAISNEWIVWLNGEIYNHNDLRKKHFSTSVETCAGDGIQFQTGSFKGNSDTETVAWCLDKKGMDIIPELNGIFAIAAYHKKSKKLYLIRDRFGAKQIYYLNTGNGIVFSSEPKAFLKYKDYSFSLNNNAVGQWLTFQNSFTDDILFDKIKLLPSGTIMECGQSPKTYHTWSFSERNISQEEILYMIKKSCIIQRPNEPIGLWLSGGLDSSILALEMNPEHCITAGWPVEKLDERKKAECISQTMGSIHHQLFLNPKNMMDYFEETICSLDDLRVGPSWSNFILNKVISKHCRITVQGTGADELFGGYQWRYDEPDYMKVLNRTNLPKDFIRVDFDKSPMLPVNIYERYAFDLKHFMQGCLIVGDRLSFAHGIEERVPFLDNDLADAALSLRGKHNKNFLRKMYLNKITDSPKRGFTSPDRPWYYNELRQWANITLSESKNLPEFVDAEQYKNILDSNNAPALWSLLSLHFFIKNYGG